MPGETGRMVIESIERPADVKGLSRAQLDVLAREIRDMLVVTCSRNGGHLAPNLGVVELTLALHRVLDLPPDKLVWDVSHQAYVHKILTGRRDRFHTLRQGGGISGFSMRSESPYDAFGAGHASTSRLRRARHGDRARSRGRDETIVAVLGDGALTGGLAYEALNNAGQLDSNFIVILNDNEMSIAPNVGSIASYLSILRSKPFANAARERREGRLASAFPSARMARKALTSAEMGAMHFVSPVEKTPSSSRSSAFGTWAPSTATTSIRSSRRSRRAKQSTGRCLLHVRTVKGKGYEPAEKDSRTFHGSERVRRRERQARGQTQRAADVLRRLRRRDDRARADATRGSSASRPRCPTAPNSRSSRRRFPSASSTSASPRRTQFALRPARRPSGLRPGLRDLFDLLAASLRSDRPRCLRAKSAGHLLHRPRGIRRRRRADAHGTLRHRVPTHAAGHDGHGAAERRRAACRCWRTRSRSTFRPRFAIRADRPAAATAIRSRRSSTGSEVLRGGSGPSTASGQLSRCSPSAIRSTWRSTPTVCSRAASSGDPIACRRSSTRASPSRSTRNSCAKLAWDHDTFLTLEEHSLAGGFGSAVVERVSDLGLPVRVQRVGVTDVLVAHDSQPSQRALFGLSAQAVAERLARALDPHQEIHR